MFIRIAIQVTSEMVDRGGFEPPKPAKERQIYSLMVLAAHPSIRV